MGKRINVYWPDVDNWLKATVFAKSSVSAGDHVVWYDDEKEKGSKAEDGIYEKLLGEDKEKYEILDEDPT